MSQRSQVSRVTLKSKITLSQWVSQSVTRLPIELLSPPLPLPTPVLMKLYNSNHCKRYLIMELFLKVRNGNGDYCGKTKRQSEVSTYTKPHWSLGIFYLKKLRRFSYSFFPIWRMFWARSVRKRKKGETPFPSISPGRQKGRNHYASSYFPPKKIESDSVGKKNVCRSRRRGKWPLTYISLSRQQQKGSKTTLLCKGSTL